MNDMRYAVRLMKSFLYTEPRNFGSVKDGFLEQEWFFDSKEDAYAFISSNKSMTYYEWVWDRRDHYFLKYNFEIVKQEYDPDYEEFIDNDTTFEEIPSIITVRRDGDNTVFTTTDIAEAIQKVKELQNEESDEEIEWFGNENFIKMYERPFD